ncbi:MAG: phage holin family protein [Candidatus Pacebacteria bacterium]|nr:phage holin family protein [Candidatus Paceibacterota bacterium]
MKRLILQIIAGILGIWLAVKFVPSVEFRGPIFVIPGPGVELSQVLGTLVFVGAFLGFLNFFVKPILDKIALPLRIITFNLFSLVISMGLIWTVDIFFEELIIQGLLPLFWITLILWGLNLVLFQLSSFRRKRR